MGRRIPFRPGTIHPSSRDGRKVRPIMVSRSIRYFRSVSRALTAILNEGTEQKNADVHLDIPGVIGRLKIHHLPDPGRRAFILVKIQDLKEDGNPDTRQPGYRILTIPR